MGVIKVDTIKVFANHGCLSEETLIGSDYIVNLKIKANLKASCLSDNLNDTVDYVLLNTIVKEEMAIASKLLETVAKRIINRIFNDAPQVKKAWVSVSKINPPIGGDVKKVTIKLKESRKNIIL